MDYNRFTTLVNLSSRGGAKTIDDVTGCISRKAELINESLREVIALDLAKSEALGGESSRPGSRQKPQARMPGPVCVAVFMAHAGSLCRLGSGEVLRRNSRKAPVLASDSFHVTLLTRSRRKKPDEAAKFLMESSKFIKRHGNAEKCGYVGGRTKDEGK